MIEASDLAAIYQYTLDNLDRVTVETQDSSGIGLVPTVRMTRGYDLVSNRTSLAAEFFVGAAVTKDFSNSYLFDGLNRVGRITQTAQGSGAGFHAVQDKRVNLTYNALGQFTFISRYENVGAVGTNLRSVYSYDQANRLTGLAHRNISGVPVATDLSVYGFTYDPMNRIKTLTHTGTTAAVTDGQSTFNYDQTSQLTLADHALARPDENLSYDLNGNRTNPGYTTGTNNQTTASQDSTAQKYSYVYDKEGNRTRRTKLAANGTTVQGVEDYTFDHRNRLTNVTVRTTVGGTVLSTVQYTYDIYNRLVKRAHDSNGPTAGGVLDTFFAGYDGINPTLEFSKADPGAGGVSAADLKHRYLWGPVVDQLFADEQFGAGTGGASSPTVGVGNTLWGLGDHLGTVRDIADFNGTSFLITNHRVYDSFGKLTAESNTSVDLAFGYTGKYNDEVTQLSLHWNRWLDTNLGKWISEDPIGFGAGDTNLASYVGNSPCAKIDPFGLAEIFVLVELDLVGLIGTELSIAVSIDFDDLSETGLFATGAFSGGLNAGIGIGGGFVTGDIEGRTGSIDGNYSFYSGTAILDPATGDFGAAGSFGLGAGGSMSINETIPVLTIGGVYNWLDDHIPDPVPTHRPHRYPNGTGNCIKGPPSKPMDLPPWLDDPSPSIFPDVKFPIGTSEENEFSDVEHEGIKKVFESYTVEAPN